MPIDFVSVPIARQGVYGFTTVMFKSNSKSSVRHLAVVLGFDIQIQCHMPGYLYTLMESNGSVVHVGDTKCTALFLRGVARGRCDVYRAVMFGSSSK